MPKEPVKLYLLSPRAEWFVRQALKCLLVPIALGLIESEFTWPALETFGVILFGWAAYLQRVLPDLQADWTVVRLAIVCLIAFLVGLHLFLRWLRRESGGSQWRVAWTLSLVSLLFLSLLVSMSAIGIAHQCAWLGRETAQFWRSKRVG